MFFCLYECDLNNYKVQASRMIKTRNDCGLEGKDKFHRLHIVASSNWIYIWKQGKQINCKAN